MSITLDKLDTPGYYTDLKEAEATGTTVEAVQEKNRLGAMAADVLGEDAEVRKARIALEKKQAELDRLEEERTKAIQEWERLIRARENAQKGQQCGEFLAESAEAELSDCTHTINLILSRQHHFPHAHDHPNLVLEMGRRVAGAKEVLALIPGWREAIATRLEEADRALISFAKRHGIEDRLGPELQAKASA